MRGDEQPIPIMLADPRRSLRIAGVLLVATLVLFALMWSMTTRSVLQEVDGTFHDFMEAVRITPLNWLAHGLAFISSTPINWTVRIAVLLALAWRRQWLHLAAFGLAIITSEALIGTTKDWFDRPRPTDSLITTSGASFPSGHAISAVVTAVGLVIALMHPGHRRWTWERQAALYAALIALSRTYLGAHWLTDVIGGSLLGSTLAIGWPALLVLWRERKELKVGDC